MPARHTRVADMLIDDAQESTRLFDAFTRSGFEAGNAHYVIESIENMAGTRIEARIGRMEKTIYLGLVALGALIAAFGLWANLSG